MLRRTWQVLLNRQGAFHQVKFLNGLSSFSAAVKSIIMVLMGTKLMHTHFGEWGEPAKVFSC